MVRFMTVGAGALLALALGAATVEGMTLRMKAPAARFFRTDGAVTRFSATVGFDPAIYTLKRKYEGAHLRETLMGFRVYADGRLVADTGLVKPGDGTRAFVEKGLADTGWTYVNLDDGWQYGAHVSAESARRSSKRRAGTAIAEAERR